MHKLFSGLFLVGLYCGVAQAQVAPRVNSGSQPRAAGQNQNEGGQDQVRQPSQQRQSSGEHNQAFGQAGQRGAEGAREGQVAGEGRGDQQIAACVYGECRNEIELAKFVEPKLQSEEVREFAQRMVREHSPRCESMQRMAGELAANGPRENESARRSGGQGGSSQAGNGQLDWLSIKAQIGQQCLASLKEELGSKQGTELDKCFMGQQIGAHMKVVDELKVLRNYASDQMRGTLDKELQMAQTHLQQATQIEQQLAAGSTARISRKPEEKK